MLRLIVDDTDKWDRAYEYTLGLRIAYDFYGKSELMQEFRQIAPEAAQTLEQKANSTTGKAKVDLLYQAHHCYQMLVVDAFVRRDVFASGNYTLRLMDLALALEEEKLILASTKSAEKSQLKLYQQRP